MPPDKSALRAQARATRRSLPPSLRKQAARKLVRQFARYALLRQARHVALYLALGSELDTGPLIAALRARGVAVYAPRIARARALRFLRLGSRCMGPAHAKGMAQPVGSRTRPLARMDVVLLPLLAYDAQGHRLGQGGGYYDRALARIGRHRPLRIGLAFASQAVAKVPVEPLDQSIHAVLTEQGLQWLARSR